MINSRKSQWNFFPGHITSKKKKMKRILIRRKREEKDKKSRGKKINRTIMSACFVHLIFFQFY